MEVQKKKAARLAVAPPAPWAASATPRVSAAFPPAPAPLAASWPSLGVVPPGGAVYAAEPLPASPAASPADAARASSNGSRESQYLSLLSSSAKVPAGAIAPPSADSRPAPVVLRRRGWEAAPTKTPRPDEPLRSSPASVHVSSAHGNSSLLAGVAAPVPGGGSVAAAAGAGAGHDLSRRKRNQPSRGVFLGDLIMPTLVCLFA